MERDFIKLKPNTINRRLVTFFKNLTDGTIAKQKPDGKEIISSMKRANHFGLTLILFQKSDVFF